MTDDELAEAMRKAWDELPPSGALTDAERKQFKKVVSGFLLPILPGDSRASDNT